MSTDIDIFNRALNKVGSDAIASFNEGGDKANTGSRQYNDTLNLLLSMCDWRFATKKRQLSRLLAAPLTYWQYAYQLPTDMIAGPDAVFNSAQVGARPMATGYEIFERTLMTNEEYIYIDYRYRPSEANFPVWFESLLVMALAGAAAMGVTTNEEIAREWNERAFGTPDKNMRGGMFATCAQINRQGAGPKIISSDELINAQHSL
jgi:hypothetical protein